MVPALCLMMVLSAAPGVNSDAPVSTGIDASDLSGFTRRPTEVERSLMGYAPTSPGVAVGASLSTLVVGMTMTTAFTWVMATGLRRPSWVGWTGLGLGLVLVNFGPNMGDLLNGDVTRFVLHGLGRVALLAISPIVFPAIFYWFALLVMDTVASKDAPARWVQRAVLPRGAAGLPTSPSEHALALRF